MIDVHYASLTSQGVQHRVFYRDSHPSRYQPRPTGLNFGEQMGTGVFPLVIAVPQLVVELLQANHLQKVRKQTQNEEMRAQQTGVSKTKTLRPKISRSVYLDKNGNSFTSLGNFHCRGTGDFRIT